MATPGSRRKKNLALNRSKNKSEQRGPQGAASELLSLMSNRKDRAVLKKMLAGGVVAVADAARAERIALKIAELAAQKEPGPQYLPIDQELLTQAMVFSGLNAKGLSYVSPEKVDAVLSSLVPKAFGEGPGTSFFNNEVLAALIDHASNPDTSPLPAATKQALLPLLTAERRQALVQMASDGRLQSSLTAQELPLIAAVPDAVSPAVAQQDQAPSSTAPADETPPVERAQLGTESIRPDSAELSAQARLEAERYQLDLDMQTDALLQLNELMRRNPTWVNRSVREKLSDYLKDKRDGLIGRDVFTHPSESLFSETLAEVDETGRAKNEMVKFSNGPINGFKASFKNPNAPKDAYLAACYRLRAEGVRHPYIKTTFRDKDAARQFLEMMVASLEESGYHIDDIRVSPNLEEMFRYLKETKYPAFTVEEAPPGVVDTPDDPAVIAEQTQPELAIDRARRLSEEMLMQKYPELSVAEALQEELKVVNGVALKFADSRSDPERPLNMRDVAPKDMVEILARRPLLALSGDSWNESVHSGGLVPTAQHVVKEVVQEFERLLDLADPRVDSGKAELGHHQASLLLLAKDTLMHVMPERAAQLSFVFDYIEGQQVNAPKNTNVASDINPDATAAGPDDYSPTERDFSPQQAATSEPSNFANGPSFDPLMPPLESYGNDIPSEWERPFDEWTPPRYDAPPLDDMPASYDTNDAFRGYPEDNVVGPVHGEQSPYSVPEPTEYNTTDPWMAPTGDPVDVSPDVTPERMDAPDVISDIQPESVEAPEDIALPQPDLSRARWDAVIGKELHDIDPSLLREIAGMTNLDAYHVQIMTPDAEWDLDAMLEFKNVVETVRQMTSSYSDATTAQSFGQREWELLAHLPSELVPDGLQSLRNDYIAKKQAVPEAPVAEPESFSIDLNALRNAVGCELHEIPTDVIRSICAMSGDEISQIRGAKEIDGWDPLQLEELRNAIETIRLLHDEPMVLESELGPRELALVRAMPEDIRPHIESASAPENDVSRPAQGPRP